MQTVARFLRHPVAYRRYATLTARGLSTRAQKVSPLAQSYRRPVQPATITIPRRRFNSSLTVPESQATQQKVQPREPSYQLTFTCKPCGNRSSHVITKHGYHKGTVLIQCPSCKNRHVISDHLDIFLDHKSTLEDILRRTAGTDKDLSKLLKKGTLGQRAGQLIGNEQEADVEFWEDGTETQHKPAHTS